jgi:uncharacterized repeat protein (TIGR03803 family)
VPQRTVFALNTNGTRFTNLHRFSLLDASIFTTNGDGANPYAGLILSGKILYGAAEQGGSSGAGMLFSLSLPPRWKKAKAAGKSRL